MNTTLTLEQLNNVSEIDVVYLRKPGRVLMADRPYIQCSDDSVQILRHYWNDGKIELQEEFKIMFLNQGNRVLHIMNASAGGMTGTVADPRIILAAALKVGAVSMVLAHNHPSGSLKPSTQDEVLTQKIKEAAKFFDMKVLDHIILTADSFFSFADNGII